MIDRQRIGAALTLDVPYEELRGIKPEHLEGRPAAVLILLGERRGNPPGADPHVLITQRTEHLPTHKGQMAFPGGMLELNETSEAAALRETFEEVGVNPGDVEIIGSLPPLWTVSHFWVQPVVGFLTDRAVDDIVLKPNADEIAAAEWFSVRKLRAPEVYQSEQREYLGKSITVHSYQMGPFRIWGATGAMLKNLFDRLEQLDRRGEVGYR